MKKAICLLIMLTLSHFCYSDIEKVVIQWDANSESDLAGYQVYYGNTSGEYDSLFDVGNITNYLIDVKTDMMYFFAVTAYDTAGNESGFSNEASCNIRSIFGDFNLDGNINFGDMILFDNNFGYSQVSSRYDFNEDGGVDFFDMVEFDRNFGR